MTPREPLSPPPPLPESAGAFIHRWLGRDQASNGLRIKFWIAGVLFPLALFGLIFREIIGLPHPSWQSGATGDYAQLLLVYPAVLPLFGLAMYSVCCLAAWTLVPALGRFVVVRVGIYAAIPVITTFLLIMYLAGAGLIVFAGVAAAVVGPGLAGCVYAYEKLVEYEFRFSIRFLLILTTICAVGAFLMRTAVPSFEPMPMEILSMTAMGTGIALGIFALAASPVLCLVAYSRAAWIVAHNTGPLTRQRILVEAAMWLAWATGACVSLRYAMLLMLEEYSKLPTTSPNCYLSAAAQSGHRWLVQRGSAARVSLQTKRLKFLELVVAICLPRFHRWVRGTYDRIGPPLARLCCGNRWFADATYVALVPLAWLADCVRRLLRVPASRVESMYEALPTKPAARTAFRESDLADLRCRRNDPPQVWTQ